MDPGHEEIREEAERRAKGDLGDLGERELDGHARAHDQRVDHEERAIRQPDQEERREEEIRRIEVEDVDRPHQDQREAGKEEEDRAEEQGANGDAPLLAIAGGPRCAREEGDAHAGEHHEERRRPAARHVDDPAQEERGGPIRGRRSPRQHELEVDEDHEDDRHGAREVEALLAGVLGCGRAGGAG